MPIISFGSQNINIITGKKNMTIRRLWKKPLKVGDRLHCYWNVVSKEKKKIFEAEITDLYLIPFKDLKNNNDLAKEEGYEDAESMVKEFKKMYVDGLKDDDIFQVIYFEKLDIKDWEGEKIDEKAMITQRADILFDNGNYKKSAMCYTAALRFDPSDVYILNKKGDNLNRLGKFQEAIESYDNALAIDDTNEHIWNNKAIALFNLEHFSQALDANAKALEINPRDITILNWRGFIFEFLERFEEALQIYNIILNIDNEDPQVWNSIGCVLTDLDRNEEALDAFDKGMELCLDDEIDASAQNRRGNAFFELGRYKEALECYNVAISIEKENTYFLKNKGLVLMELGEFNAAEKLFTTVLAIDPDDGDANDFKLDCLNNM